MGDGGVLEDETRGQKCRATHGEGVEMTNKHSFLSSASLGSLAAFAFMIASAPAVAQSASGAASDESSSANETIVVTGSRLVTDGFESPTPITVVTGEQLRTAAPSSIGDSLNQLPVFRNSNTPQGTGVGTTGNVGQSFLNLRALGAQRTLILLDGRRVVPSTSAGATDISILPDVLVSRVDVVTGGASAAYGSDAVAGVVNFVLDTKFQGVKANIQAGVAEEGDNANQRIEVAAGHAFAGGRGHVLASAGYYKNDGMANWTQRDWYNSCSRISNPAINPAFVIRCGVHSAGFTRGGLITGGPLKGTEFGPGGVPTTFNYGDLATTLSMVGGSGEDHGANFPAIPAVERKTGFGRLSYDVTDNVTIFGEILAAEAKARYASTAPWEGQSTGYTMQIDNHFLPQSVRDRMIDAGVTSFPMWRYDYDFGLLIANSRNRTMRYTAGVNVDLGGWKIDAYYEHGRNKYHQTTQNNPIINRLYNAADVVTGPDGGPICRSTLTQPGNGCVPLNLFGFGSPSAEALGWMTGTTVQNQVVTQDVAELSVAGSPFDLWAGPVSVAFGGGYRRESSVQTVDATSTMIREFTGGYLGWPSAIDGQLGGWERTNPQPLSGHYNVKEVFGEILIPLLRDSAIGRSAELNAAVRYTDYSTSGGVTTWKVGLTYEPIPDIKLRATQSRDIRAANINELFTGSTQGQGNLTDHNFPVGDPNNRPVVMVRSFGNPTIRPERADTTTAGIVVQPSFFPGFSASVDYYNIKIKDAVGTLGGQTTIDQCFAGATALCSLLHRGPGGTLVSVDTPYLNIAARKTNGVDIELSYRTSIGADTLSFRGLATYIHKLTVENPGAPIIDTAGQTGGAGVPHWTMNGSVNYQTSGGFGVYLQGRYIGPGALDKTLTPAQLAPEDNHVKSAFYADLTLTQKILDRRDGLNAELFLTINNLFDKSPPLAPSAFFVFGVSNGSTNVNLFDIMGRRYTAGARIRF
jgi:outer membrane receptor protein involved in Fe transport